MYNGVPLSSNLGGFDPNSADLINALGQAKPQFSGANPQTQALMSAISGQAPEPAPDPGGWPVLDAMSGYGDMEPTKAPPGGRLWGTLTPSQALSEVSSGIPAIKKDVSARQEELGRARARPDEAPALSFMGMPLVSAEEVRQKADQDLAEAQSRKTHAEAQLAGEAALPTTTPLRNAAESAFQSAGTSYASVPKFAGYIGGWLANEAGADIHPTDNAVFRLGDEADKWAKSAFPGDPARADEFGTKAAHLTGFLATLYGAGGVKAMTEGGPELAAKIGDAVTKGSQVGLAAGTGGMGQFEGATAAMEAGKEQHPMAGVTLTPQGLPVSERDRAMATLLGAGVGLTSMIPMASTMATAGEKEIGATMARALEGSGVNASQMAAFNVLNNAIAREYYDPNRALTQGMESDVGLGALVGGATHGFAAATGPKRLSTPEEVKAFIEAAQRSDPDPAKATYWRGMHEMADEKLKQLPAPAVPEPGNLSEAGPYALRGRTDWREEAHGDRSPADRGAGSQNIGAGEEVGPSGRGGELPSESREAQSPRPVVGTETFDYKDKNGSPVVGAVNNEKPAKGYTGRVVFRAYPEGTTISRTESPKKLGEPLSRITLNQHPDGSWEVGMMETHPDQGGRHLTGNMLDKVEERLGGKLKAPGTFWPDGYRLWSKRDPKAVQHHQEVDGEHLSPATLKRQIDQNQKSIDEADPIRDWEYISDVQKENRKLTEAFEKVPEHARTPEALENQFAIRGVHGTNADIQKIEKDKFGAGDPGYYGHGFYMYPYDYAKETSGHSGTFYGIPKEGARNYLLNLDTKNPFYIEGGHESTLTSPKADWDKLKPHGWEHENTPVAMWGDDAAVEKARAEAPQELKDRAAEAEANLQKAHDELYGFYERNGKLKPGADPDAVQAAKDRYEEVQQTDTQARRALNPEALLSKKFTQAVLDAGHDSIIVTKEGKPYEMVGIKPGTLSTTFGDDPMYAKAPERAIKMMDAALRGGKTIAISRAATSEVHDSIANVRHVAPEDVGVHALAKLEPRADGRLTAVFQDASGADLRLVADSLSDLTNLRGFCLNDGGNICIPNFYASGAAKSSPASGSEVRTPDAHGGVFVHEAVHSLLRRGLIPADDWTRLVDHANSLRVLDMPMHEYFDAIGEDVKPGPDTLRDNYKIAYQNYDKAEQQALLNEEEPVAHMMELIYHGHFGEDHLMPIDDLLRKFIGGEYAQSAPKKAGGRSLDDIKAELEKSVKALYASEFPKKDAEDFGTHGWWALGTGKNTYGEQDVLDRMRKANPELVKEYRDAYKAMREERLKRSLEEAKE